MFEVFASNDVHPINIPDLVLSSIQGSRWLSSWWLATVVSVLCLVLAAALLFYHHPLAQNLPARGGQRKTKARFRAGATVRIAGVLFLVLTAGAFIVNSSAGYVPDVSAAKRVISAATSQGGGLDAPGASASPAQGAVSVVPMPGDSALRIPAGDARVYTPPGYEASGKTRYPVLYLIHGYPGTAADWFTYGQVDGAMDTLIQKKLIVPRIVVSLDINSAAEYDTECLDSTNGPKVESWIYARAVPRIDELYPTQEGRTGRILGGFSAGGFCALDQGLRHQDTWGVILSFEGFGEPGESGPAAFGDDPEEISAHSPEDYIPRMRFTHPQAFYLDSGEGSGLERVKELADLLKERQQKVYYRVNHEDDHSWSEVRAGLPYALVFASRQLPDP